MPGVYVSPELVLGLEGYATYSLQATRRHARSGHNPDEYAQSLPPCSRPDRLWEGGPLGRIHLHVAPGWIGGI